jgi:hypothetical protein
LVDKISLLRGDTMDFGIVYVVGLVTGFFWGFARGKNK